MSTPRLFTEDDLSAGAERTATPAQAHHLGVVLRRRPGDPVLLFNGRDGEWSARLATLRKDRCTLAIEAQTRPQAPEPDLRLLIAALKREPMDWLVEKATELGATRIQPVVTRRTVADRSNTARLTGIARAAAEQCRRLTIPAIADAAPLHQVLDRWDGAPLLAGDEHREAPSLRATAARLNLALPFGWLVGPEGGFERAELDDLRRRPFVAMVALGPRILRAETAAVAGLAALQALAGDWN